jgi:pimeloyl-ACP methyl ester carboxylesterase
MKVKQVVLIVVLILIAAFLGVYFLLSPEKIKLNDDVRTETGGSFIQLSDGYTHYSLTGPEDGRLAVFVHGGTIPMWTWDRQIDFLNNAGFKVLVYDKYGRGLSDRPRVTYDQELYKRQLYELVEKLEPDRRFDLVGLSVGGGTAVNFTAAYPQKVENLVLIAPLITDFAVLGISKIPVLGEIVMRLIGINIIVDRFNILYAGNPDAEKYKQLYYDQTRYKGFQRSLLSMLRNDAVRDYTPAYKTVGAQDREVILIWGKEDTDITPEMIDEIKALLPNLDFNPVDGAGHGIVPEKPELINGFLLEFLR